MAEKKNWLANENCKCRRNQTTSGADNSVDKGDAIGNANVDKTNELTL